MSKPSQKIAIAKNSHFNTKTNCIDDNNVLPNLYLLIKLACAHDRLQPYFIFNWLENETVKNRLKLPCTMRINTNPLHDMGLAVAGHGSRAHGLATFFFFFFCLQQD